MKSLAFGLPMLLLALGCAPERSSPLGTEVYFSPRGGCTEAIVRALNRASNSVLIQAYCFTSAPIAESVVAAHRRGVKVQLILDSSQRTEKFSGADFFKNYNIPTFIDDQHAIAHNKVMILDNLLIITGSFNFTKAAEERNAENLLLIYDPVLASKYTLNWQVHARHSQAYRRPDPSPR